MLVLAFHIVDVMSDTSHSRQRHDDVRVAASASVAVFNNVLQQQVIFEDPLHWFQ